MSAGRKLHPCAWTHAQSSCTSSKFFNWSGNNKLQQIIDKNEIDQQNYVFVLGNLLCEGIVDELQITAKKLVDTPNKEVKYTPEKLRNYKRALDRAMPKILEYLLV